MSWDQYVETQLIATGAVCAAGIFGKADMQCYAQSGDLQLRAFNAKVAQDDGSEKEVAINEAANLLAYISTSTRPSGGFWLNNDKYQILREMEGPTAYLKRAKGGACVAATNTLVIIGVFDDEKNKGASLAACNQAVEGLAEYLRSAGY